MNTTRHEPRTIGRYKVEAELGQGAMAKVYLATDPTLGRKIALKVLDPDSGHATLVQKELETRFLIEARAAAKLEHPGAVAIYDAGTDPESSLSYIAMEWIDGPSLAQHLHCGGPLAVTETVELGARVAGALGAAHQLGLIHRDVKPGNILMNPKGEAKLSDFGIVKTPDLELTSTGQVLGTPFYMSPEQIRDEDLDGRSDLFSLGVVLYLCATGELPFSADSLPTITHKILSVDPKPVQELDSKLPDSLSAIITRLLEKDPADRFQTAEELVGALEEATPGAAKPEPTISPNTSPSAYTPTARIDSNPAGSPGRRSRIHRWWLPLAAGLILIGLFIALSQLDPNEAPVSYLTSLSAPSTDPITASNQPTPTLTSIGQTATLEVLFKSRLKGGSISLWVDGKLADSRYLPRHKGLAQRAAGKEMKLPIRLEPGRHLLEVRISGSSTKIDAVKQIEAVFDPGETRRLRVVLVPPSFLRLDWK